MTNYQPRRTGTKGQRERFACRQCGKIASMAGLVWYISNAEIADKRTGAGWDLRCRTAEKCVSADALR